MLWAFVALAMLELLVTHLFLSLKWPMLAWPLSVLTGVMIIWVVRWLRSWARLPHELHADFLRLHMGSLVQRDLPLALIEEIVPVSTAEQIKGKGVLNMVPLAFPNRLIRLTEPLQGRRRAMQCFAIRLDDPEAFDVAMRVRMASVTSQESLGA